jgi:hypothetical protein
MLPSGSGRIAMYLAAQSSVQLQTVFGGGYVLEQHSDAAHRYLPPSVVGEGFESLTASMFDEVMKSLRSALSLR